MIIRKHQFELHYCRFKIAIAVRETASANHQVFQVRKIPLSDMSVTSVCLLHCHGGKRHCTVNKILQHSGHPVAIQRKTEQQQIT